MNEYKQAFKAKCTECIWKMINDESVKHMTFYTQICSIELLWYAFLQKLKTSNSLLSHTDLYKEYLERLDMVYKESTKS